MKAISKNLTFIGARMTILLCALTTFATAGVAQSTSEQPSSNAATEQPIAPPADPERRPLQGSVEDRYITPGRERSARILRAPGDPMSDERTDERTEEQPKPLRDVVLPHWLPSYMRALTAALPQAQLEGRVNIDVQRPSYIPAYAYSNENMVAPYHNLDTNWADNRPISNLPQWMKLSPSVVQFWHGTKADPYWVMTVPDKDHPGNFTFSSQYEGGPKGWLQSTGERSVWGHPEYRYWFDPT